MSELIRVRDKKKGIIRMITRQAYMAMGPKVYEKLGNEAEQSTPQVHRAVSAPVIKPQIKVEQEQAPEHEQVETQAEPELNEVESSTENQPKRRGRKPGTKNQISSDSTGTEE